LRRTYDTEEPPIELQAEEQAIVERIRKLHASIRVLRAKDDGIYKQMRLLENRL